MNGGGSSAIAGVGVMVWLLPTACTSGVGVAVAVGAAMPATMCTSDTNGGGAGADIGTVVPPTTRVFSNSRMSPIMLFPRGLSSCSHSVIAFGAVVPCYVNTAKRGYVFVTNPWQKCTRDRKECRARENEILYVVL